jgi:hypothetical protein
MEDCVRGWQESEPSRAPRQFGQLQFHWGKPPPAADPSTRTHMQVPGCLNKELRDCRTGAWRRLSVPVRQAAQRRVTSDTRTWSLRPRSRTLRIRVSSTPQSSPPFYHVQVRERRIRPPSPFAASSRRGSGQVCGKGIASVVPSRGSRSGPCPPGSEGNAARCSQPECSSRRAATAEGANPQGGR